MFAMLARIKCSKFYPDLQLFRRKALHEFSILNVGLCAPGFRPTELFSLCLFFNFLTV